MTFTRTSSDDEWPFWEASLNGTSFETKAQAWQSWFAGRSDATMTVDTSADGLTLHADITCADQTAWNTYKAAYDSEVENDQWADSNVTSYMSGNGISVAVSEGEV
jgi:hypothetical protein